MFNFVDPTGAAVFASVGPVDPGPTAGNGAVTEGHGQTATLTALINGLITPGIAGDTETLTSVSAEHGNALLGANDAITYTAPATGPDTISYTVADQNGDTATGHVAVTVDPGPTAGNGAVTEGHGQTVTLTALINGLITPGLAGDTETLTSVSAAHGNAVLGPNNAVTYTAPAIGPDRISYTVADQYGDTASGQVAVTIEQSRTADLLQLSFDTYNTTPVGGDGYRELTPPVQTGAGFEAVAYINAADDSIVITFRGTQINDYKTLLNNIFVDASFALGNPTPQLVDYVKSAVSFVQSVYAIAQSQYPGASITLTGHSLGGALAQLIGEVSHLTTVAFNAPGAGGALFQNLQSYLSPVQNLGAGGTDTNYRVSGDQFSLFGTPLGQTVTIKSPYTSDTASLPDVIAHVLDNHGVGSKGYQDAFKNLQDPTQYTLGVAGPNYVSAVQAALQSPLGNDVRIAVDVAAGVTLAFDPAAGTAFVFTEDGGSPNFASIELPFEPGVGAYNVRYETGTSWSAFQQVQPGVLDILPAGVVGIEFDPLDASSQPVQISAGFLFTASFASDGHFSGTLTVTGAIVDNVALVTQLYLDILGRGPDPGGLTFWTAALQNGESLQDVRTAFANSGEAQGDLTLIYNQVLGRAPDPGGLAAWTGDLANGAALQDVRSAIANSGEAKGDLTAIYNHVLGRAPDAGGLAAWTGDLANGAALQDVRSAIANSGEAQGDLTAIYNQVLGRAPDAGGLAAWTGDLANGASLPQVRSAIANSGEAQGDLAAIFQNVEGRSPDMAELAGMEGQLAPSGATLSGVQAGLIANGPSGFTVLAVPSGNQELCRNLGDDGLREAAYRGGWRARQHLLEGVIRHVERLYRPAAASA
jgi:Domain of unknown function (DUF4214)/Lipase (class 3)